MARSRTLLTQQITAGQNVLGHTTTRITEAHYEHALPEEALRGMVDR